MFFLDTCFWTHAKIIWEHKIYDFRGLIEMFQFGITPQVRKELEYWLGDLLDLSKFFVKPVLKKDFEEIAQKNAMITNFDLADQSLFCIGLNSISNRTRSLSGQVKDAKRGAIWH